MKFYENLEEVMKNLSKTGAFLTAKDEDGNVNTMTISWGYIGFSWNKPQFVALVRPQRYTQEIIKNAKSFTVSVPFDGKLKEELKICGTKSGRDIKKDEVVSFIDSKTVDTPIVDGCDVYYECEIQYVDRYEGERFPEAVQKFYKGDYHFLYFGEIVDCYKRGK